MLVLAAPVILLAHARLVRSQPSAGETLQVSPASIRLVFSENPMAAVTRVVLVGTSGDTIRLGAARTDTADGHAIVVDVVSPLDSGKYSIHWSTAASDGHVSRGVFSFTVATPRAAKADTAVAPILPTGVGHIDSSSVPSDSESNEAAVISYPQMVVRWLGFLALFCVVGAVAFRYAVLQRIRKVSPSEDPFFDIASDGAATLGMFAAVAYLLTTVIRLYGESAAMHDVSVQTILLSTSWGRVWTIQAAACVLAIAAFRQAHRVDGKGWLFAMFSSLILVVTPAYTGHAIAGEYAVFSVPLDIVHVIAGSVWLGTLAVIFIVGIGAALKTPGGMNAPARVATLVNAFSPMALICGGTIVGTGVIAGKFHLDPLSELWTSSYGKTILVKLFFVVLLFAVGFWNWRKVKPSLGGETGLLHFRKSARFELVAAALVLAVTAVLVAVALPE